MVAIGDFEDAALRLLDDVAHLQCVVVGVGDDRGRDPLQLAPHAQRLDDARVVLDVGGGGNRRGEVQDLGGATARFQLAGTVQLVAEGDQVDCLVAVVQGENRLVDLAMAGPIEILGPQVAQHGGQRLRVKQQRAEGSDLGVDIVRRNGVAELELAAAAGGVGLRHCHGRRRPANGFPVR